MTSGIRVGTPAVTTRGFTEAEMKKIGHLMKCAAADFDAQKAYIDEQVETICNQFPVYGEF